MKKRNKHVADNAFDSRTMLLSPDTPFSVMEAYKTLRTNITFSLPGSDCKCIGVTSADRGDGKSSVASNVAISLGQIDKKVALIDCDLRLPTIAQKFRIRAIPGLSNWLSGDIDEIPMMHLDDKNIDVLPAGNLPPDSTTLISSQEMIKLVERLKMSYDYIVFDFPPITIVSDAVLISNIIDGYLVVVRHEKTEYASLNETVRQMRFADAKIIGAVYNGLDVSKKYYKKGRYYKNNYYKDGYYK